MSEKASRPASRPAAENKLSRDRICAAALELIDQNGLDRFSVRDLARSLSVYPTAIYWHMPNRNVVLAEVVGYALRNVYPATGHPQWKVWIRKLFEQYREAIQKHPNIAPLVGASLLSGSGIRPEMIEYILLALTQAGFTDDTIVDAYNVVIAAQVGYVTLELAALPAEAPEKWAAEYQQQIRTIDVLSYPMLARHLPKLANRAFILRWSNGTEHPMDDSFEFWVNVVLDGLSAALTAQKAN
jgi:AcrR family transcriptional regulator